MAVRELTGAEVRALGLERNEVVFTPRPGPRTPSLAPKGEKPKDEKPSSEPKK